jgi:hypothetical protein
LILGPDPARAIADQDPGGIGAVEENRKFSPEEFRLIRDEPASRTLNAPWFSVLRFLLRARRETSSFFRDDRVLQPGSGGTSFRAQGFNGIDLGGS